VSVPFPTPKGVLVFADGRTEVMLGSPMGKYYVRGCEKCGGRVFFDSAPEMAEDENTINPEDPTDRKRHTLSRSDASKFNGGCIVYIQRRKL